jgi:hypothetical protein
MPVFLMALMLTSMEEEEEAPVVPTLWLEYRQEVVAA